ncbi:MAG TPA: polyprenyl synthetase family protein [Turneriella sp.]|nr:polyprenyl synthetase family protein [Turneriella sp.]HNL52786.1 polyprenyl synthetase family protein [Turneriella sp.]HNM99403.1 polyprenyl synthetase family protein [Turneriella sp.]
MQEILQQRKSRFERDFLSLLRSTSLKSAPAGLREATEYALSGSNKRLRPVLVLEASRLAGLPEPRALLVAAAFECLHSYSLVHDDLPAMDDDDLRRGQPSCHKKYGEATAILVGDLLQSLSFELLARAQMPAIALQYFARAVGAQGMVSGQFIDMQADTENTRKLHRLKTGKLIESAITLPYLARGEKLSLRVVRWGRGLGLLFQITDDLLDATADSATLGKTAGKDAEQHKKTFVAQLGLEETKAQAQQITARLEDSAKEIFPASELFRALPAYLLNRRN